MVKRVIAESDSSDGEDDVPLSAAAATAVPTIPPKDNTVLDTKDPDTKDALKNFHDHNPTTYGNHSPNTHSNTTNENLNDVDSDGDVPMAAANGKEKGVAVKAQRNLVQEEEDVSAVASTSSSTSNSNTRPTSASNKNSNKQQRQTAATNKKKTAQKRKKAASNSSGSDSNSSDNDDDDNESSGDSSSDGSSTNISSDDDDSDSDAKKPARKRAPKKPSTKKATSTKPPPKKRVKKEDSASPAPVSTKKGAKPSNKKKTTAAARVKKEDEDTDASNSTSVAMKSEAGDGGKKKRKGKGSKVKKEEDGSEVEEGEEAQNYEWWLDEQSDGKVKWDTLEHNGVLFPPPYEALPEDIKMKYNGVEVTLPPESEEVAGFFGAMLETDHAKNPTFVKNFFGDWQEILAKHPPIQPKGLKIANFDACDFTPMHEHFQRERERKKTLTKEEKARIKKQKDELEAPFKHCVLNGRKEKVGNFRVEPPGLFRGRGAHPRTGKLKLRVTPDMITINIGEDAKVPEAPDGAEWGKVLHDNKVSWLAGWNENINNAFKYVFLAAGSSLKGMSDYKKFEKARKLKDHIDRIRKDYQEELLDKVMATRQRATAIYLIDRLALRAGNEKGDDEADTVGCCSLRVEHITLSPPNTVLFDFLGKDSIRYLQEVKVDDQVFKNLRIFKKPPKEEGDMLFDRLNTMTLNKHLSDYMPGLSAKVFRTYNASWTFQQELDKTDPDASVAEKLLAYNRANRQVAILCNHQRSVSKTHGTQMEKLDDKIRALKYQRRRLRHTLFALDKSYKKSHKQYLEDESDMDDDWMEEHEKDLCTKAKETARKKFEKDNDKARAEGKDEKDDDWLEEKLKDIDALYKEYAEEREANEVTPKKGQTAAKIIEQIQKKEQAIEQQRVAKVDREEGKETSLSTSKINYIDPRLSFAWCKKFDVPVERVFTKTLREKFPWAASVDTDWRF